MPIFIQVGLRCAQNKIGLLNRNFKWGFPIFNGIQGRADKAFDDGSSKSDYPESKTLQVTEKKNEERRRKPTDHC